MQVKVVYFASAEDLADVRSEPISVGEGSTLGALVEETKRLHPGLRRLQRSTRYSVNFEIAEEGRPLRDGDEVGVLPPVAGG